jgi:PII-like signaling protein
MKIPSQGKLLRVFIGEADRWRGRPLHEAIVAEARRRGLAGATVLKGFLGFGAKSHLHTAKLLRLSEDLPVVIEIVDSEKKIAAFLPTLDAMVAEGLVTLEKVRVLRYRPKMMYTNPTFQNPRAPRKRRGSARLGLLSRPPRRTSWGSRGPEPGRKGGPS